MSYATTYRLYFYTRALFVVFIVFQFVHIYINHTNIFSVWFTQGHSNVRSIGKCFIISEGGYNG